MSNFFRKISSNLLALGLCCGITSVASAERICPVAADNDEIVFGFFNGVQNDVNQALFSLALFRSIHGKEYRSSGKSVPIRYDLFYNYARSGIVSYQLAWWKDDSDFDEVKAQVRMEIEEMRVEKSLAALKKSNDNATGKNTLVDRVFQDRYEDLFRAMDGKEVYSQALWERAVESAAWDSNKAKNIKRNFTGLMDKYQKEIQDLHAVAAKELNLLDLTNAEMTALLDYQRHRAQIDLHTMMGRKLFFVAHSQGNLFANRAYDYAIRKRETAPDTVKVFHIAPASFRLAYPSATAVVADKDHVILTFLDLIEDMGGSAIKPSIRRKSGEDLIVAVSPPPPSTPTIVPSVGIRVITIPNVLNRKLLAAREQLFSTLWNVRKERHDPLGHGLYEIYLNPVLPGNITPPIAQDVKNKINHDLMMLAAAPKLGSTATLGFVTVMLTWDGEGDVDLHVREPDGTHVYYGNKQGKSGALDHDNTEKDGPEHYYIACENDKSRLLGAYQISVANYNRSATGRTAEITVTDWGGDGTPASTSIVLEDTTAEKPIYNLVVYESFVANRPYKWLVESAVD